MKDPALCDAALRWLKSEKPDRADCRHNKHILAPLTGQDYRALKTFVHALDLYSASDAAGQRLAILCMHAAVHAMQPNTRWIAREAIAHQFDWDTHERLWPQLIGNWAEGGAA